MLRGDSVFHMRQSAGLYYDKKYVSGYYSDLRHKVTGDVLLDDNGVVYNVTNLGDTVYFAITIFQYGLGAYDLFIETKEEGYLSKMMASVKWAVENQQENGSWNAFGWEKPSSPYSSMAQSEGASLLCRAYQETKDSKYLNAAVKAIRFMLTPIEEGGVSIYGENSVTFEEKTDVKTILNGMVFSIWGLWDVCQLFEDAELKKILNVSIDTLVKILPKYDRGYWSNYDLDGHICSPFYHDLHIEQLKVMYDLFGREEFKDRQKKWERYNASGLKRKLAFGVKGVQKLRTIDTTLSLVK